MRQSLAGLVAVAVLGWSAPAAAALDPASAPARPANDYADKADWLCWPGATPNACDVDLTTTVVEPGGATHLEAFHAAKAAPIDCFYVYPTVSTDRGLLATMAKEPAELRVVEQQFARFGASCRLFAPLYRQYTLTALIAGMTGHPLEGGARPTTPYDDVRDAWTYYLAHANHGRGVVLIGHSQGSGMLTELIKREIDGKPARKRLVSAILMGTALDVPPGKLVGGAFKTVPLCQSKSETGCVIAYASFRDTSPPPADSRFGKSRDDAGMTAACVNPANLSGGEGALRAYLTAGDRAIAAGGSPPPVWSKGKTVSTPFVSLPGMLSARCASGSTGDYLAIHIAPDMRGGRTRDINGDVVFNGQVLKDWGLHLIDANLAMGNLVDIVADQGRAWTAARR
jgi:hypothetical protein